MSGTEAKSSSATHGDGRLRRCAAAAVLALVTASLVETVWRPAQSAPAPPFEAYDRDYPAIDYSGNATRNAVAALQRRLARHELALEETAGRGYLDSLLAALDIDASSQVLVFSKTSLQAAYIDSKRPRAIYFNDSTYVAWVQGSDHLEVLAIDDDRGPTFFSLTNAPPRELELERQSTLCLACHDSAGLRGGGVPSVLVRSSSVSGEMNPAGRALPAAVTHATAIEDRWGGWYVTGLLGVQQHLGNLPLVGPPDETVARITNRSNLPSLADYVETAPYMSDKSDIVALLVLEHQSYVHNLITQAKYALSAHPAAAREVSLERLSTQDRAALEAALEPLVAAMTFEDERRLLGRVRGNAGFEAVFAARGPVDACGRSLRDFELTTRTFRYPLSYLVYTPAFATLPALAKRYVYGRLKAILRSPTGNAALDRDRAAALEIAAATLPELAAAVGSLPAQAGCG